MAKFRSRVSLKNCLGNNRPPSILDYPKRRRRSRTCARLGTFHGAPPPLHGSDHSAPASVPRFLGSERLLAGLSVAPSSPAVRARVGNPPGAVPSRLEGRFRAKSAKWIGAALTRLLPNSKTTDGNLHSLKTSALPGEELPARICSSVIVYVCCYLFVIGRSESRRLS